jgi:hypothetical protein
MSNAERDTVRVDAIDDELLQQPLYPPLDETGFVDLSQIDAMLSLTPQQRIQQFCGYLEFIELARQARIKRYGYDPAADGSVEAAE